MPRVVYKFLVFSLFSSLSSLSLANIQTLKTLERQWINTYKNADFYQVNQEIEEKISDALSKDPQSIHYDFPELQKAGLIKIHYSPDNKLKFYNFDVGGGGTMGEWSNYVQYEINNHVHFDVFSAGYIRDTYQSKLSTKTVYLVESYYKGDNCTGAYHLRAVELGRKQLLKSAVFQTKNKQFEHITVDFDCRTLPPDAAEAPEYFRIRPNAVDVMLLNKQGIPQNQYLHYRQAKTGYIYSGIVK